MTTVNTDGLKVTESEATELCVHHLRLAFLFYLSSEGSTPEQNRLFLEEEVERQCVRRDETGWGLAAIRAFLDEAVEQDKLEVQRNGGPEEPQLPGYNPTEIDE